MIVLLYTIHVLICFFLIAVVLLQQGKGADLSVFGGGATQTAFGARGAATVLHKMTVISFVLFIVTTLGIGIVQSERGASEIFEGLDDEAAATATTTSDEAASASDETATEEPAEEPGGAFEVGSDEATDDAAATEDASDDGAVEGADEGTEMGADESEGATGGDDAGSEAGGADS